MKNLIAIFGLLVSQIVLSTQVWGQATCNIDAQKKQFIESVLCGQASPDKAYLQSGVGCFERSVTMRLQDSAAQIFMYKKCVDAQFAAELRVATIKAMEFMEDLSVCVNEDVDLDAVLGERIAFVQNKGATLNCSIRMKTMLFQRRPAFEAMIQQSKEFDQFILFEKLGVAIDEKGNILDR